MRDRYGDNDSDVPGWRDEKISVSTHVTSGWPCDVPICCMSLSAAQRRGFREALDMHLESAAAVTRDGGDTRRRGLHGGQDSESSNPARRRVTTRTSTHALFSFRIDEVSKKSSFSVYAGQYIPTLHNNNNINTSPSMWRGALGPPTRTFRIFFVCVRRASAPPFLQRRHHRRCRVSIRSRNGAKAGEHEGSQVSD